MTKRVSIHKCRMCVHYNGHYCHLDDLAPCRYKATPEAEHQRIRDWLFLIVSLFVIALLTTLCLLTGCTRQEAPKEEYHWSAVELLKEYHGQKDGLTEWEELILAIAYTESKFKDDAVGAANDTGQLQITEQYVREVNRLYKTSYTLEDAFDFGKSLEMYDLMQRAYNPDRDLNEAIKHHNRNAYYKATVLENLALILRYEETRKQIIEYGK